MKKTLLTLALVAASAAAFAQGKVLFANNGSSLVTLADSAHVMAADQGVAGLPVATSGPALPSGVRLDVGLYIGTSSSSLALVTTTTAGSSSTVSPLLLNPASGGSGVAGQWSPSGYTVNGSAGAVFLQVKVWDSAFATYDLALAGNAYTGLDNVFQMTLGSGITYPNMTSAGGSTWAAAGNNNPIIVGVPAITPEPGTMALAGLGAAAMMIFRRRK